MKRRFRFRWLLKWTGTTACVVILVAAAACLRWRGVLFIAGDRFFAGIYGGAIYWQWAGPWQPSRVLALLQDISLGFDVHEGSPDWRGDGLSPRYVPASSNFGTFRYSWASFPLWIPFVLLGIPTALLWRLDRRRPRPGYCARCNYDLTGNVTCCCPECGEPCSLPQAAADRSPVEVSPSYHSPKDRA